MWLLLQIADSAFPAGGFAHSAGLEVHVQRGDVRTSEDLERFARATVWQAAAGGLPFVSAGARDLLAADSACDAFLLGTTTNLASRTQGRAFASTAARVFSEAASIGALASSRATPAHLAPVFGAVAAALGVAPREAKGVFLYTTLRQVLSAAVRLGVIGPHEAQRLQRAAEPTLDAALAACEHAEEPVQTAPVVEIVANLHEALYSRLFQS